MGEQLVWDSEALSKPHPDDDLGSDDKETKAAAWLKYKTYAGISVAVVWSHTLGDFSFYSSTDVGEYGLDALADRLEAADSVVDFCGDYDLTVLYHALGRRPLHVAQVDLHHRIRKSVGWDPNQWPRGSWKLNRVAQDTIGAAKTAEGAMAPSMAAEARWAQLFKYCMQDVVITRDLWLFICKYGYVVDPHGMKWEVKLNVTSRRSAPWEK